MHRQHRFAVIYPWLFRVLPARSVPTPLSLRRPTVMILSERRQPRWCALRKRELSLPCVSAPLVVLSVLSSSCVASEINAAAT